MAALADIGSMEKQVRNFPAQIRRKADPTTDREIEGVAAVYDTRIQMWGGISEEIAPGAFRDSIEGGKVKVLMGHNSSQVLGSQASGTAFEDTDSEMRFSSPLADTTLGKDTYALVERGDLDGMSVGFIIRDYERLESDDETSIFRITRGDLLEVSVVVWPAYEDTSVQIAARDFWQSKMPLPRREIPQIEKII